MHVFTNRPGIDWVNGRGATGVNAVSHFTYFTPSLFSLINNYVGGGPLPNSAGSDDDGP
jgi:hypothetical protein